MTSKPRRTKYSEVELQAMNEEQRAAALRFNDKLAQHERKGAAAPASRTRTVRP